jgi:hypothetical protein
MPSRIRLIALAVAAALAGCADRTSSDPLTEAPTGLEPVARAEPATPDAARERLARRLAVALAEPKFRARLKQDLERSPFREQKLHFQRYLASADRHALRELARSAREPEGAVETEARAAFPLELYLPVPEHRLTWNGDDRILVATARGDRDAPVAYTTRGERLMLSAAVPPGTPVLALVPVETDFDRPEGGANIIFDGGGPGTSTPPPGLYMTRAHFVETFEGWLKGAPEFEVHMLGQAGSSDSLTSYSCAGERAGGYYTFNQDKLDWTGSVLLITQTALASYKAAHSNQNMRVFVVEDDDTSCQIKTDVTRFSSLVKAVETAYPTLTGGKDTTGSNIAKAWKKANALQKLIKAVASVIVTNDELVGNAVESSVVGVSYPGANWVVKGASNKTTGWINLIMK